MKTSIKLIAAALILSTAIFAQTLKESSVPDAVKNSCKQKFPTAKKIEWKLKSDKNYEAEFFLKGVEIAAKFTPDGKWLETESAIKSKAVPSSVTKAIQTDFPGYKTIERQSIEKPDSKEFIYEIHIKKDKEVVKLQYSTDGKQLTKSVKTEK